MNIKRYFKLKNNKEKLLFFIFITLYWLILYLIVKDKPFSYFYNYKPMQKLKEVVDLYIQ
jgi:hypothetical protein